MKPFVQASPQLGNQFLQDWVLQSYLKRLMPAHVYEKIEPSLIEMGELSGGDLFRLQMADLKNEPVLTQWDAWGNRIDHIEVSTLWKVAEKISAEKGLIAAAYEKEYGPLSRPYQFALAYLFHPSSDFYTCPLAMTDGAARTLLKSGNRELIERALPHLTSRDPQFFWTSGQWMTEATGGSDVGLSEAVARKNEKGIWRLYGRKWFTSATTSQMALTLGRPEGNPPGGKGLGLFYIELRDDKGRLQNILVNRLKDKLGTRKVPTAELTLEGTPAQLVMGTSNGVANIIPMLHITRTWNSITAVAMMGRGLALAEDYARKRVAFGAPLSQKPLHVDTLAGLQAEAAAAFHLSFLLTELLGLDETYEISGEEKKLFRLLTSIVKLTTGKQAVNVVSEVIETFGGAGYVEDTGLPLLIRDSQVFPIWEGTTNVLSLDTLRALVKEDSFPALKTKVEQCVNNVSDSKLQWAGKTAQDALAHAETWFNGALKKGQGEMEAGARRFAMTLGRALGLALLVEQGEWSLQQEKDGRARAAALRFAQSGIDLIGDFELEDSRVLLGE